MKSLIAVLTLVCCHIPAHAFEFKWPDEPVEAQKNLCVSYLKSDYLDSALTPCRLDAEDGDVLAMHNLAVIYHRQEEYASALRWAQKAALKGDAAMMNFVGHYYQHGLAGKKSQTREHYWYRRSAEAGDINGQYSLGVHYERNLMWDEAAIWYKKLFEAKHPGGTGKLAYLYTNGRGVKRDVGMGYVLARISKQMGDQTAQRVIDFIENRLSTEEDKIKLEAYAEEWMSKGSSLPS